MLGAQAAHAALDPFLPSPAGVPLDHQRPDLIMPCTYAASSHSQASPGAVFTLLFHAGTFGRESQSVYRPIIQAVSTACRAAPALSR
jgi:hypothetical protein